MMCFFHDVPVPNSAAAAEFSMCFGEDIPYSSQADHNITLILEY